MHARSDPGGGVAVRKISSFLPLALCGCIGLPALPPSTQIPLDRVVEAVQCELKEAVLAASVGRPWFQDEWEASFALTLKVTQESKLSPSVTFIAPLDTGERFSPGVGGVLGQSAVRTNVLKFKVRPLNSLYSLNCQSAAPGGDPLLNGLGLREVLERDLGALNEGSSAAKRPTSLGYTVEFGVEASASFSPGLVLVRFTGLGSASSRRTNTNTLDIAFGKTPDDKPQRVVVVRGQQIILPGSAGADPAGETLQQLQFERLLPSQ